MFIEIILIFPHKWKDVIDNTQYDGYTHNEIISWDYRFSNLCNFKCRMCGPMLSSAWETEVRKQGKIQPMDGKTLKQKNRRIPKRYS